MKSINLHHNTSIFAFFLDLESGMTIMSVGLRQLADTISVRGAVTIRLLMVDTVFIRVEQVAVLFLGLLFDDDAVLVDHIVLYESCDPSGRVKTC